MSHTYFRRSLRESEETNIFVEPMRSRTPGFLPPDARRAISAYLRTTTVVAETLKPRFPD